MRKLSKEAALKMSEARWGKVCCLEKDYPWRKIESDNHNNGMGTKEIMEKYNISRGN